MDKCENCGTKALLDTCDGCGADVCESCLENPSGRFPWLCLECFDKGSLAPEPA